jgi:hypothetical protein
VLLQLLARGAHAQVACRHLQPDTRSQRALPVRSQPERYPEVLARQGLQDPLSQQAGPGPCPQACMQAVGLPLTLSHLGPLSVQACKPAKQACESSDPHTPAVAHGLAGRRLPASRACPPGVTSQLQGRPARSCSARSCTETRIPTPAPASALPAGPRLSRPGTSTSPKETQDASAIASRTES